MARQELAQRFAQSFQTTTLEQRRAFRRELGGVLLLTAASVGASAAVVAIPWPAAALVGLLYVFLYGVLVLAVQNERLRRLRRLLLIGWGLFLWIGLVVAAVLIRGTTAYTANVSRNTVGTPICNIGNLWIITGLLTRGEMLLGTTMLGFLTTTAGWLGLTIAFGRGWCGWFCYLGVPLEIAALLRRRRGQGRLWRAIRRNRLPAHWSHFRYALLLSAILLSAWLITPAFCWICPVRVLFDQWELHFDLLNVVTAGTGIFLFCSTMVVGPMLTGKRVWCVYFCPLGAVTSLLAWLRARVKLPVVSARISVDKCQGCLTCVSACGFNVLSPQLIERATAAGEDIVTSAECTTCGDCVSVCPDGAIELASGSRLLTRPAVRWRAYALSLTFFVFLTVFLWAQFIPMFGPK